MEKKFVLLGLEHKRGIKGLKNHPMKGTVKFSTNLNK